MGGRALSAFGTKLMWLKKQLVRESILTLLAMKQGIMITLQNLLKLIKFFLRLIDKLSRMKKNLLKSAFKVEKECAEGDLIKIKSKPKNPKFKP